MQRRTFFKAFAAVAGYLGANKMAAATTPPPTPLDHLPINTISAGPPVEASPEAYAEGPYIITLAGLSFIAPSYYMGARYNSEFTVHMASGMVLKNKVARSDGRLIEPGESLEIPILDDLIDHAAMWPELDPDDELNDALAGRSRKANQWTPRVRGALLRGGDAAERIRAFHSASIGKSTYYRDWPV